MKFSPAGYITETGGRELLILSRHADGTLGGGDGDAFHQPGDSYIMLIKRDIFVVWVHLYLSYRYGRSIPAREDIQDRAKPNLKARC